MHDKVLPLGLQLSVHWVVIHRASITDDVFRRVDFSIAEFLVNAVAVVIGGRRSPFLAVI